MGNIFSRLLPARLTGMDKAVVGKAADKGNKTGISVTAAIFFDGTGNNRNNTAQRRMSVHNKQRPDAPMTQEEGIDFKPEGYEKYGRNKEGKPKDSYEAGYSNVSILERMNRLRKLPQKEISLYVEGIGTQNDKGDDLLGNSFGIFKTGIKNKVKIGVSRLAEQLAKVLEIQDDTFIEKITIDVFGFSRGATAARHFVSLMHAQTPLAAQLGCPDAEVIIKFVGVFDTVSSYGVGVGFGSDVDGLGLDLSSVPTKMVHLVAGNEYRQNFSVTDITSSIQVGVGYELVLPGVHSDVGGSYGEVTDEEERHLLDEERLTLIEQGWYRSEEITRTSHPVYDPETGYLLYTTHKSVGRRCDLTWEYQFIALGLMAEYAAKSDMKLEPLAVGSRFEKYTLAADHALQPVQQAIVKQAGDHGQQGRHVLCFPDDPTLPFENSPIPTPKPEPVKVSLEVAKHTRNRYLHRSASTGIQGLNDGRPGMAERRLEHHPHRLVFVG